MKPNHHIAATIACALLGSAALTAEEPTPEIAGLQKTAAEFITAYNNQDAAALAALFTEDGELTDSDGSDITSGRGQILERYREIFSGKPKQIAIEVGSVRFVAPNLAIEDGTFHLTPAGDETFPPQSNTYTAVLTKDTSGEWRIASSRNLKDVTDAAGRLSPLAEILKGEWTCQTPDGVRLDLAIGWDAGGRFLTGEMLTTTADAEPQQGTIRISWNAAEKQIVSWMFDAQGGATYGIWIPSNDGWLVRSSGTTSDGESLSASQQLNTDGQDTLVWAVSQRILNGETAPDKTFRFVRRAPEPAAE
jgi:uncharacterized protein (TIGR02246 family)